MRMRPLPLLLQLLVFTCVCVPLVHGVVMMEAVMEGANNPDQPFISVGWQAAMESANNNRREGIRTNRLAVPCQDECVPHSIKREMTRLNALMVFGLYDDDATHAVMQSPIFTDANLVLFGPYTQSTGVRTWSDNVYFMTCDPMMELISLMNTFFQEAPAGRPRRFGNIGWMFLRDYLFDDTLPSLFRNQLQLLGLRPPVVYEQPVDSDFVQSNFDKFIAQEPSSVFLFGARGTHTTSFFTALVKCTHAVKSFDFFILMPFALMYTTGAAYQTLYLTNRISLLDMTMLRYSAPLPFPSDGSRAATAKFQSDMKAYDSSLDRHALETTSGFLFYYGWVVLQQMSYISRRFNLGGGVNHADLKKNAFSQHMFNFDDIVLGTYGGKCVNEKTTTKLGAACSCNQGGHYVAVVKVAGVAASPRPSVNSGVSLSRANEYFFPHKPCYTNQNVQYGPKFIYNAAVGIVSPAELYSVGAEMAAALQKIALSPSEFGHVSSFAFSAPSAALSARTGAEAKAVVLAQTRATTLSVLFGPVAAPFTPSAMSDYFFVEPIVSPPVLDNDPSPNAMYVSATLRQQINIAASYLGTLAKQKASGIAGGVHVRCRDDDASPFIDAVGRSLGFFGVPLQSGRGVAPTRNLIDDIPQTGYTFVFGLQPNDIAPLRRFLVAHSNANVIISFDELTLFYSQFHSVIGDTMEPYMTRLLFATNMPSWTDASSTGDVFQKFVWSSAVSMHTPAAMRAFVGALVMDTLSAKSNNISSASFAPVLYRLASVTVDGRSFGPYSKTHMLGPNGSPMNGPVNYGARDIALWSYTRVVKPSTPFVAEPQTLAVMYAAPIRASVASVASSPSRSMTSAHSNHSLDAMAATLPACKLMPLLTTATTCAVDRPGSLIAWKYALLVLLALVFVGLLVFAIHLCCTVLPCFGGEPMHCAPVDCDAATTVVFVEVEKWPDVQRAVPEASAECVAEYRNIVRRLVEKHDCYECGSWMDAFMVVSRHADSALKFAASLQKELDGMHGPAVDAVDAAYAVLGLPSSVCVRGLRVRVGVHTDVVDIAYDVDTDHYEYRGSGCVAALRTERLAHGGQVLVTGATCEALTEKQLACVSAVSVGTHSFDEYDDPVPLFELVVLPQREFGSVHPHPVPLACGERLLAMCVDGEKRGTTDDVALAVEVLALSHDGFPWAERVQLLRWSCEQCGLRVPPHASGVSNRGYEAILLRLLAEYSCRTTSTAPTVDAKLNALK